MGDKEVKDEVIPRNILVDLYGPEHLEGNTIYFLTNGRDYLRIRSAEGFLCPSKSWRGYPAEILYHSTDITSQNLCGFNTIEDLLKEFKKENNGQVRLRIMGEASELRQKLSGLED